MIDILVDYRPLSFIDYKRKLVGSFPSSFNELSPAQLIAVSKLTSNTISDISFLKILTGYKKSVIKMLSDYHRYSLMNLFDFFTEIKPHHSFIVPFISTSSGKLYSPQPKLSGITMGQFIFAESYFRSYQENNKTADLCKFVSCFYLPVNTVFSENIIPASVLSLSKVKPEILEAVFINYVFIKEWLCLAYPMIFIAHIPGEKQTNKKSDNMGWLKIFENIVGDDIVNYDKYALLPVHNVFRWMTLKLKENRKYKKT